MMPAYCRRGTACPTAELNVGGLPRRRERNNSRNPTSCEKPSGVSDGAGRRVIACDAGLTETKDNARRWGTRRAPLRGSGRRAITARRDHAPRLIVLLAGLTTPCIPPNRCPASS